MGRIKTPKQQKSQEAMLQFYETWLLIRSELGKKRAALNKGGSSQQGGVIKTGIAIPTFRSHNGLLHST
jgi:hypothetical protein